MKMKKSNNNLFPYARVRPQQDKLIERIEYAINKGLNIVAHAPTGLGKTAASLTPVIDYAIQNNLTVFFLTSRHTQHKIAIDTLCEMKKKSKTNIIVADLIGKKWMCSQEGVNVLQSSEFHDYCKKLRENNQCKFFTKTKTNKLTVEAKKLLSELKAKGPLHYDDLIHFARKLCPHEIVLEHAKSANVIVTDYYYIFDSSIRNSFLAKIGKSLEDAIIIIDEGHNLPTRLRELKSARLTTHMIERAIREAKKYGYKETIGNLQLLNNALLSDFENNEKIIAKNEFIDYIEKTKDYEQLAKDLIYFGEAVRDEQKISYIMGIAGFLLSWKGTDDGFTRILSKDSKRNMLAYRCMDPALVSREVFEETHSVIVMSGTLTPVEMHKKLLGLKEEDLAEEFENPFPEHNRLNIVVPKTTTKFTKRNEQQYQQIAEECAKISNEMNGKVILFFPSYVLRDCVYKYFATKSTKTCILEHTQFGKDEKKLILEKFKKFKNAVLLAVIGGSFSEGIDLPGDLLNGIIVVGLPLSKPDLYTQELIKYYDAKFGNGWDYGYVMPAMNKCFQSAGRCIRTEKDRGVIVFLDERFIWPTYKKYFPYDCTVSLDPTEIISDFY